MTDGRLRCVFDPRSCVWYVEQQGARVAGPFTALGAALQQARSML